jgi:hypothetical protein
MNRRAVLITSFILLLVMVTSVYGATTLPIKVTPLKSGNIRMNEQFDYRFDFTNDSTCLEIILSIDETINTNNYGEGFTELDIENLTYPPEYLCEYREGTLRKVHNISTAIFGKAFGKGNTLIKGNLTVDGNITADNYYGIGSLLQLSCADTEIPKYNNSASAWECEDDKDSGGSPTDIWVNETGDTMTGDLHVNADINTTGNITLDDKLKFTGTDSLILYSGDTVIRSGSSSSDDLSIRGGSGQYPFINMSGTNVIKIGTGIGLPIEFYQANQVFSELRMTATNWVNMTSNNYDAFKWYADGIDTEDMITWSADNLTTGNYLNADEKFIVHGNYYYGNGTYLTDISGSDTKVEGSGYLYNDSTYVYLNESELNVTINLLENDTLADLSCADTEIAKWNNTASAWECETDNSTGGAGSDETNLIVWTNNTTDTYIKSGYPQNITIGDMLIFNSSVTDGKIYMGNAGTDDGTIYANTVDSYPYIILNGASDIAVVAHTDKNVFLKSGATSIAKFNKLNLEIWSTAIGTDAINIYANAETVGTVLDMSADSITASGEYIDADEKFIVHGNANITTVGLLLRKWYLPY